MGNLYSIMVIKKLERKKKFHWNWSKTIKKVVAYKKAYICSFKNDEDPKNQNSAIR
jgi:hypothetical protein